MEEIKTKEDGGVEKFGEPDYQKLLGLEEDNLLKLEGGHKWTIWEMKQYETKTKLQSEDYYMSNCNKIAWFDNLISFHLAWKNIPHSMPSSVLYDASSNIFKTFDDGTGGIYQVTQIMMFKTGIKPAWEDPVNANGGDFRVDIGALRDNELLAKIWEALVFDIVSGQAPSVEQVAGITLVQKAKDWNLQNFRLEVWMMEGDEFNDNNKKMKDYLESKIILDLLRDKKIKDIRWSSHSKH